MAGKRPSDVSPEILAALNAGERETAHLAESLALSFPALMGSAFPDLPEETIARLDTKAGITRRMEQAARLIREALGPGALEHARQHPSDTVRGWACHLIALEHSDPKPLLEEIRPLAADHHFGVREWAWMAARPGLVSQLGESIELLAPWTASPDANVRRFAAESLRPRGVWCKHIAALREDPTPGLPLLEPLRNDSEKYVQDSVANWLNDAAKDHPDWVRETCARWLAESPTKATGRICKRAQRSL